MAINTRPGTSIQDFQPDDTQDTFFLSTEFETPTMSEIAKLAMAKWGREVDLSDVKISAEHIHTSCLGYDRYDSGDYTNFLRISYTPRQG